MFLINTYGLLLERLLWNLSSIYYINKSWYHKYQQNFFLDAIFFLIVRVSLSANFAKHIYDQWNLNVLYCCQMTFVVLCKLSQPSRKKAKKLWGGLMISRGHLYNPYLWNTIGFRRDFPSTAEDLGARNNLNRQSNMATVSKSPLPPMPPRPQSVPLLRKTMSPEPSNVKASPIRSKTPLVRKRSRCYRDFSSQRFHLHNRFIASFLKY